MMCDDGENLISFKWNNHQTSFFNVLANLRAKDIYTDVTLACDQSFVPAHKLVLSSCSDYFKEVFARAACISPVVILKDIKITELEALIDYMYLGVADVKEDEVNGVLRAAECLRIKGLGVPDEALNSSLSTMSLINENEASFPNKKIKLENENKKSSSSILIGYNDIKKPETPNSRKKRIPKAKRFPLLMEAKKHAVSSSRSTNNFKKLPKPQIRNKNSITSHAQLASSEIKREINVVALPTSEKKVQLMTLEMKEQNFEGESPALEPSLQYPASHYSYDKNVLVHDKDNIKLNIGNSKQIYSSNVTPKVESIYDYSSPENNMDSEISPFVKNASGSGGLKSFRKHVSNSNHPTKEDMGVSRSPNELYKNLSGEQDYNIRKNKMPELNFESSDFIEIQPSNLEENNKTSNISDGDLNFTADGLKTYGKQVFSPANMLEETPLNDDIDNFTEVVDYTNEENRLAEFANASGSAETRASGLKLPKFTPKVYPFLYGEKVDEKQHKKLRAFMVDELISHFTARALRSNLLFPEIESLILSQYPKVTKDEHPKRKGHLGYLFTSVTNKIQRQTRNSSNLGTDAES